MIKFLLPCIFIFFLCPLPLAWYNLCLSYTLLFFLLSLFAYSPLSGALYSSTYLFFLDNLSWPLIILTLWIFILRTLARQTLWVTSQRIRLFLFLCLFLLLTLIFCFVRKNLLIFYFFFEISLIPTLLLIIIWGYQPERLQAGLYLIIYTISASLPFLMSILLISTTLGHLDITLLFPPILTTLPLSFLWSLQLSIAFLVKLPLYATHLWLPKAHVEAPVAGSIILAGILLKLGVYGLLRITTLIPQIIPSLTSIILPISIVGATITRWVCLRQTDFKALIAYSSVGHIGLLAAGLFSGFYWGWQGALLISIAHGLSSSALFALANMLYLTASTRSLYLIKGIQTLFPTITIWWFLFCIRNIAAPPTLNLLAEIILISSALASTYIALIPLILLTFLRASYSLFLFVSTQHGTLRNQINPLLLCSSNNHTILFLHLSPLILLILSPELVANWLF